MCDEVEHLRAEVEAWEMIAIGAIRDRERLAMEVKQLKAQLEYRSEHPIRMLGEIPF